MGHTKTRPNPMHTKIISSIRVVLGELRSEQVAKMLPKSAAIHWPANKTLACTTEKKQFRETKSEISELRKSKITVKYAEIYDLYE